MYVRKNEYNLYDSVFGFGGDKSGVFYSIESNKIVPFESNQVYLAQVRFNIDHQIDQYERTVQTIFEVIGIIGGNYEILRISIGLFLATYTNKMLSHEINNKCWFHTHKSQPNDRQQNFTNKSRTNFKEIRNDDELEDDDIRSKFEQMKREINSRV